MIAAEWLTVDQILIQISNCKQGLQNAQDQLKRLKKESEYKIIKFFI